MKIEKITKYKVLNKEFDTEADAQKYADQQDIINFLIDYTCNIRDVDIEQILNVLNEYYTIVKK